MGEVRLRGLAEPAQADSNVIKASIATFIYDMAVHRREAADPRLKLSIGSTPIFLRVHPD